MPRSASPMARIVAAGAVVILFLLMPIVWAIVAGVALVAVVLLLEPRIANRDTMVALLLFVVGFLAKVPVVFAILWVGVRSSGRDVFLPTVFGSALMVSALFLFSLKSWRDSMAARLLSSGLSEASGGLLLAASLLAVFWQDSMD